MHSIPWRREGITFSASVSSSVAYRSMCAPHNTCVPFSRSATNRILGKALDPRLEPGRPKALSLSAVSATASVLPSRLTSRHCRYQAPLVRFPAMGACNAQKLDPTLRSLLRETIFVMQAAQYGSLHHTVSERQPVSVLGGRDMLRDGLRQTRA